MAQRSGYQGGTVIQGGGGNGAPTVVLADPRQRVDVPVLGARLPEMRRRSDTPVLGAVFPEARQRSDVLSQQILMTVVEPRQRRDQGVMTVMWPAQPRSATPDTDAWGDGWTDATATGVTANHGAENTMQISQLTAATQGIGWLEVDLTRFTGLTATGGNHVLAFTASTSNLTAVQLTLSAAPSAGRPFVESTLTNNSKPASPNAITKTVTVPAGTATVPSTTPLSVSFSDAEMTSLLGRWLLVALTVPVGTALAVLVPTREAATQRMSLTFTTATA